MTRAPFIVIDGKLYRWKDILDLRRARWQPPKPRREASWRCSRPCTTTAAHSPSARHRGAIWNQACSPIGPCSVSWSFAEPYLYVLVSRRYQRPGA